LYRVGVLLLRRHMTPETKVKTAIMQRIAAEGRLDTWCIKIYADAMQGTGTIDLLGAWHGRPFFIEGKAEGKKPTATQYATIERARRGGFISGYADSVEMFIRLVGELDSGKP